MLSAIFAIRYVGSRQCASQSRLNSCATWYVQFVANSVLYVACTAGLLRPSAWMRSSSCCSSAASLLSFHFSYQSYSLVAVAPAPMTVRMYSALGQCQLRMHGGDEVVTYGFSKGPHFAAPLRSK